ncbi:MAG: hypothetical protein AAF570_11415 [Bacteroidota bacterium]
MTRSISKKLLAAMVLVVVLNSCKKYDDGPSFSLRSKMNRLTGTWELVSVINGSIPTGITFFFEFDKDGDFTWTYDYGQYRYAYSGDWEWEDQKETIEITLDNEVTEFKVKRLSNKELNIEYSYGNSTQEWQFQKSSN